MVRKETRVSRHFLGQNDLSPHEILTIFDLAEELKQDRFDPRLPGRTLVMFFEKPSTRTRLSFEAGMAQLGGHAIYLDRNSSQLSRGESLTDTARVISRYADVIMARVNEHSTLTELAEHATVPVLNGLSDLEHPCQSMADLLTIREKKGRVEGLTIAYVGDGSNNVAQSLVLGATALGAHVRVGTPRDLPPRADILELAEKNAQTSGGSLDVLWSPEKAVQDADVVYTDVWVSMGQEGGESTRLAQLQPYQVNEQLVRRAQGDCIFMHCLPAHIGQEVTAGVAYGPTSVIFDQAENRLHVQKAIMLSLIQNNRPED